MRRAALVDLAGNPIVVKPDEKIRFATPHKTEYPSLATWREARNQTIGASEAAAVLGLHPYLSPLELYSIKAGLVEPDSQEENEMLEWGQRLEEPIVKAYQEKTGRKVIRYGTHIFRHPDYPISTSLDGEILPIDDRGGGVLEIKTTSAYSEKDLQAELPIEYQIQMQHEMGVMGFRWASLAVLLLPSRKFRYQDLERNDEFVEMLFRKELEFLKRIEENNPPAPDSSESASEAIKKLFPRDSGETAILPPESARWDRELQEAKAEIADWEKIKTANENFFKAAIGTNTFGQLPDGSKYSWKLQAREGYYVKPSEFRVLRKVGK